MGEGLHSSLKFGTVLLHCHIGVWLCSCFAANLGLLVKECIVSLMFEAVLALLSHRCGRVIALHMGLKFAYVT